MDSNFPNRPDCTVFVFCYLSKHSYRKYFLTRLAFVIVCRGGKELFKRCQRRSPRFHPLLHLRLPLVHHLLHRQRPRRSCIKPSLVAASLLRVTTQRPAYCSSTGRAGRIHDLCSVNFIVLFFHFVHRC